MPREKALELSRVAAVPGGGGSDGTGEEGERRVSRHGNGDGRPGRDEGPGRRRRAEGSRADGLRLPGVRGLPREAAGLQGNLVGRRGRAPGGRRGGERGDVNRSGGRRGARIAGGGGRAHHPEGGREDECRATHDFPAVTSGSGEHTGSRSRSLSRVPMKLANRPEGASGGKREAGRRNRLGPPT